MEVAYAKAARLLSELAGVSLSARSIRRQVLSIAPDRLGPEVEEVPIMLLDGTGVRAGDAKLGVGLHLAIGLVARRRKEVREVQRAREAMKRCRAEGHTADEEENDDDG